MALTDAERNSIAAEANTRGVTPAMLARLLRDAETGDDEILSDFFAEAGLNVSHISDDSHAESSNTGGNVVVDF